MNSDMINLPFQCVFASFNCHRRVTWCSESEVWHQQQNDVLKPFIIITRHSSDPRANHFEFLHVKYN